MDTNNDFDMDTFRAECKAHAEAEAAKRAELSDDPDKAMRLSLEAAKAERDALSHKRAMGDDPDWTAEMDAYEANKAAVEAAMDTEPNDL